MKTTLRSLLKKRTFLSWGVAVFMFCLRLALPAEAKVISASLSNTAIPFETIGTTGTTLTFRLDNTGGDVVVDIHRLVNTNDPITAENLVAGISYPGLSPGATQTFFWDAFWLLGGDSGRQNGNYKFVLTQGSDQFFLSTLAHITSVDIHAVTFSTSFDANNNPVFPYIIQYALAKDSLVTVKIQDSLGTVVRNLITNYPQLGEEQSSVTMQWDGLDNNSRPVALGIYTVVVDARDPGSADVAITRTRTRAVLSLANLNSNLQKLFDTNTYVYPNPVRDGHATFQALAIRNNAVIRVRVYTLAGDLVREETSPTLSTAQLYTFNWDVTNKAGKKLGRGLYYVVVREDDPEGTVQTIKKVAVIP